MEKLFYLFRKRRKFILYSLLKVLILIMGLVTNIFIVRKLSIDDYGIFSVAFMLIGLMTTFGFSWSSSSILFYASKEKNKYGNINKTFWARNIIIFFSLIITTLIIIIYRKEINNYIGIDISFLLLIWLYVSVAEDYLSQYFLAVKKQILSTLLSLTAKFIYIILVLLIPFDVKSIIILNIISHASVLFYIIGINRRDIGRFEFDRSWFNEVLNFSLWQLFGYSGLYLINFGDTAVIKHFMTNADVGIYNAAYKLFSAVAGFAFVISSYYASNVTQAFAEKNTNKIKNFFYKERYFIFGVSTIAHLLIIIFSKPIILTLYGERYIQSVLIFNILMIGSIFRYLSVFYMLYYNTNKKHKLQQVINIISAILNFGLDIIFIKIFGIIGPAIATSLTIIVALLFSMFYCEKRIRTSCSKKEIF